MRRHTAPWLLAAFLLSASSASSEEVTDQDRFDLWNHCAPVELVVDTLSEDAIDIGLTQSAITVSVRSRLRAARLYASEDYEALWSILYIDTNVVSNAFNASVQYMKLVDDIASDLGSWASTWGKAFLGTHGRDPDYILSSVSLLIDLFIDEYLRVNADACQ